MSFRIHSEMKICDIKLKVSHLERSIDFYKTVVGLKLLDQENRTARLTADGTTALMVLEELPQAVIVPPRSAAGLYHFALLLPNRKNLGAALQHLIDVGIQIGQADHLVSEALYITDPDQNGIEIYCDRPRDTWKYDEDGNVLMATEPIDWQGLLDEAEKMIWEGLPSETRIGHVHFHVSDLEQSKAFYCDLLGFEITTYTWRQRGALFISAGGYHHHIGLNIWAGAGVSPASDKSTGMAYYTIEVPKRANLEQLIARLEQAQISVWKKDQIWYTKDPSGIQLRLRKAI